MTETKSPKWSAAQLGGAPPKFRRSTAYTWGSFAVKSNPRGAKISKEKIAFCSRLCYNQHPAVGKTLAVTVMSEQMILHPYPPLMVSEPIKKGYRDPAWISFITLSLLILASICHIIAIPSNLAERDVLLKIQAEAYETEEEQTTAAEASDNVQKIIGIATLLVLWASGIAFLFWTHRIVKNAHCLTYHPLRFSPGWAVLYYFIPILNLFRPLQALSDAHRVSKNPGDWWAASGSSLLVWWWVIHILTGVVDRVVAKVLIKADTVDEFLVMNACNTLLDFMYVLLNLLTLGVVWKLYRSQQDAYDQVVYFPPLLVEPEVYEQLPLETWVIPTHTSGWAIAAGYAGLFAVLFFPAPIAIILGIIALRDCKQRSMEGRGRAIFAIVMGAVFSISLLLFLLLFLIACIFG